MPVQIQTSTPEVSQEEVTTSAHHRTQVCAVDVHFLYQEQSIRAVGDHVLLESNKKAQAKEPPEPTQQELIVKAYQEAGFTQTADNGQFFGTRLVCDAHGRSIAPYCKKFTRPRSIEGSMIRRNSLDERKWVPFSPSSSRKIKASSALTLKCRHHCKVLHGWNGYRVKKLEEPPSVHGKD